MESLTYTVEEVASLLGIARGKAYQHVRAGDIPSIRMGKRVLIPRDRFHARLNRESAKSAGVA